MEEIKQVLIIVVSSGAGASVVGWIFKTQIKNIVGAALNAQSIETMQRDIQATQEDLRETKTNYNAKFADAKAHTTAEVDRAVESIEKLAQKIDTQQAIVSGIQITCASRHGVTQ
jgi:hypothetical protein